MPDPESKLEGHASSWPSIPYIVIARNPQPAGDAAIQYPPLMNSEQGDKVKGTIDEITIDYLIYFIYHHDLKEKQHVDSRTDRTL